MEQQKKGITTAAWMAQQSFHQLPVETQPEPKQPQVLMVDRWNGTGWTTIECVWNGERYEEAK